MSAREAKNGFGRLVDLARLEPVTIEKHGRGVVVVIALEEYDRLISSLQNGGSSSNMNKEGRKAGKAE
jgi:prevent-host-death family protein